MCTLILSLHVVSCKLENLDLDTSLSLQHIKKSDCQWSKFYFFFFNRESDKGDDTVKSEKMQKTQERNLTNLTHNLRVMSKQMSGE